MTQAEKIKALEEEHAQYVAQCEKRLSIVEQKYADLYASVMKIIGEQREEIVRLSNELNAVREEERKRRARVHKAIKSE